MYYLIHEVFNVFFFFAICRHCHRHRQIALEDLNNSRDVDDMMLNIPVDEIPMNPQPPQPSQPPQQQQLPPLPQPVPPPPPPLSASLLPNGEIYVCTKCIEEEEEDQQNPITSTCNNSKAGQNEEKKKPVILKDISIPSTSAIVSTAVVTPTRRSGRVAEKNKKLPVIFIGMSFSYFLLLHY